jgi:nucleotide-sensitive chloride channel 1A
VTLFSSSKGKGITLSYPAIALHALGTHNSSPAVYLQLNLHDTELTNSVDEMETLDMHIIPTTSETSSTPDSTFTPAKLLYDALSACADLHPDPTTPGEDGEDTAPGAGGWITSENMGDFMDEDGNFVRPQGSLGAGAGTVREREEEDAAEEGVNGDGDAGETKWQRTG